MRGRAEIYWYTYLYSWVCETIREIDPLQNSKSPPPNIKKDWMTFFLHSDPESIPIPSMENSTTERLTSSGGIIM